MSDANKTIVVFLQFQTSPCSDWVENIEYCQIDPESEHPQLRSGTAFIDSVCEMHRLAKTSMKITNIVIG